MAFEEKKDLPPEWVEMPAPTAWPMATALGIVLLGAGLVTHPAVSVVGLIVALRSAVGWFREDLPGEKHERVRLRSEVERPQAIKVSPRTVTQLKAGEAGHRVRIPAEIHPYSSGIKGGLFGGVAMAIVACTYGMIAQHSVWYPINLMAAVALPALTYADLEQLRAFHGVGFVVALISHGVFSILVGLLFAVLLPMLPSRRSAFWGSFVAPLFWSALVGATLRLINPTLNAQIDWLWFIASQIAFGLTTGYIVHHSEMVETMQTWPLAARAGLESPGFMQEKGEEE